MLGNFSFGTTQARAIRFCWELLTGEFGLPRTGSRPPSHRRRRCFELWKKVAGLGEDRILRLGEKDNSVHGDTGPCGPCSEVHFHQGDHLPAPGSSGTTCLGPACDCDRLVEIWNLVFMQFPTGRSARMTPLPKPSIDTGNGLERLARCQGKQVQLRHRPAPAADRPRQRLEWQPAAMRSRTSVRVIAITRARPRS